MATNAPDYPADLTTLDANEMLDSLPPFLHQSIHIREVFEALGAELGIARAATEAAQYVFPADDSPSWLLDTWEQQLGLDSTVRAAVMTTSERARSIRAWLPWTNTTGDGYVPTYTVSRLTSSDVATIAYLSVWPDATEGLVQAVTTDPGKVLVETPTSFPSDRIGLLVATLDRMMPAHVQVSLADEDSRWLLAIHGGIAVDPEYGLDTPSGSPSDSEGFGSTGTSLPSGWVWLNQDGASYEEGSGLGTITLPTDGALHAIVREVPVSTGGWAFDLVFGNTTDATEHGIVFYDDTTGRMVLAGYSEDLGAYFLRERNLSGTISSNVATVPSTGWTDFLEVLANLPVPVGMANESRFEWFIWDDTDDVVLAEEPDLHDVGSHMTVTHVGFFGVNDSGSSAVVSVDSADVYINAAPSFELDEPTGSPSDSETFDGSGSTPPSGWVWLNKGTATYNETSGYGEITMASDGAVHALVRDIPALTNWEFNVQVDSDDITEYGIVFYDDSNGKMVLCSWDENAGGYVLKERSFDGSVSSTIATVAASRPTVNPLTIWSRIEEEGGLYSWYASPNFGSNVQTLADVWSDSGHDLGAFMSPTHIGFFGVNETGSSATVQCLQAIVYNYD